MTGGGFGGSVVALVPSDLVDTVRAAVDAPVQVFRPASGAGQVPFTPEPL